MAHRPQISLLVPFRASAWTPDRTRLWDWLQRYWEWELPDAEVVIGVSTRPIFSKTEAVNDAASRATGRVFVILDSDAYLRGEQILEAARAIETAARHNIKRWYVPYRRLYRLTQQASEKVLASDPKWPHRFPSRPDIKELETPNAAAYGHLFGAMCQIMPREAFECVGGMDPRFAGWGGEDVAFVRALDTLFAKNKTLDQEILHLWHPSIGHNATNKQWEGQSAPGPNGNLAKRYHRATGDIAAMRALCDEWKPKP